MKQYLLQLAALMVISGISFCAAWKEKKCPPEGVELKPVNMEEYSALVNNWNLERCSSSLYCDKLSCSEYTYGKSEKGLYFHGSSYNESSNKVWATTGFFAMKEPGVFEGTFEDKRADGTFYLLLINKKIYILAGCLNNKEFGVWVNTKEETLDLHDEQLIEETIKKNHLEKLLHLDVAANNNCAKKKSSVE